MPLYRVSLVPRPAAAEEDASKGRRAKAVQRAERLVRFVDFAVLQRRPKAVSEDSEERFAATRGWRAMVMLSQDGGATRRVTRGKIVQKWTRCQLEPGVRKCQAAWSDCGKGGTPREVSHISRHFHARQSGSPTVRVSLAIPTKSLPCALARGDNDRDKIEKGYSLLESESALIVKNW
ncbi:hypothetical protein M422DRAFT_277015 [Sphaerobolus stellatus SS14]|uniref:Uncharacterized protein n=1 Tax=Sphaerobolus stellatus (strain SS14) TaxID=990650 RepID=A0A0C9UAJ8_SPHS4|nr:hypothetical protein M422DRAFT_277015 [Sphaerobolus stellatus SS14]